MKDCTTCKYGYEDEQLGIPMCHHPKRFSDDCIDFNMHEEKEIKEVETSGSSEIPKDLKEAAEEYAKTSFTRPYSDTPEEVVTIIEPDKCAGFIAGAKWQKEQLLPLAENICKTCQKVHSDEFQNDLYELGRKRMKEDMMDGAVEGTMYEQPDGTTFLDCQASFPEGMFHHEDKVKLIIVKEDEK